VIKKIRNSDGPVDAEGQAIGYDKIHIIILGVFAAYIVTWFLQLGSRMPALGAIRFEALLAVALLGLAMVTRRQKMSSSGLAGFVVAFFLALVVEIPFSYNVEYSWLVFVDRVVKFAFLAFFIVVFVRSPLALKLFLFALILAWLKIGQEEWIGRVTGSLVWQNQGVMRLNGTTGMFSHPTSLSGLGLGMIPFIYYLFPIANKWGKGVLLLLLLFSLNIILYTGARTGYVGLILFAVYIFWRSQHKLKFTVAAVLICAVAIPNIPDQYIARFQSITGQEAEGHSKLKRLEILQDAAVIFAEHPFGVGVSAFMTVREQRFGRFQDTHNLYMEILTNLGIQGFIVWVALIVAIFRRTARLTREFTAQLTAMRDRAKEHSTDRTMIRHCADLKLMLAMVNAVTAYLVIRLIVGFFGMDLYEIYWWLVLGLVVALHNLNQVATRITKYHLDRTAPPTDAAQRIEPPGESPATTAGFLMPSRLRSGKTSLGN
jgi:putative inorganic carbon (hco3(-)) transporter